MPRRVSRRPSRRHLALLLPVLLACSVLASCGSGTTDDPLGATAERLDAVTVSGDVGSAPDVTWKSVMTVGTPTSGTPVTTTLTAGTGAAIAAGTQTLVNYWVGDGYTQTAVFDTFGPKEAGFADTVGSPGAQPATVNDLVSSFIATQIKAGMTLGSRLVITANSSQVFGDQNVFATPVVQKGIGNSDGMLIVADLVDQKVLPEADGAQQKPPSWAPTLVFKKSLPVSLDFKGTPAPTSKLRVAVLKKGTGPVVAKGDIMVANYVGQVYQGAKPFDTSFGKTPLPTAIGLGQVVKGWDQGLVGLHVGSRVLLQIPPKLGYGKKGQGDTIPGGSTLYFVIDLLAAA